MIWVYNWREACSEKEAAIGISKRHNHYSFHSLDIMLHQFIIFSYSGVRNISDSIWSNDELILWEKRYINEVIAEEEEYYEQMLSIFMIRRSPRGLRGLLFTTGLLCLRFLVRYFFTLSLASLRRLSVGGSRFTLHCKCLL